MNRNYNKVNGWLFLDKPSGKSSNYVLQKIKKQFNINKLGFVGTLDPLASGFLPIAFGKATKTIRYIEKSYKEYLFSINWGIKTSTGDYEGEIVNTNKTIPDLKSIREALIKMKNIKRQTPHKFSAKKINGIRAYNLARKGVNFELSAQHINILEFDLKESQNNSATFYVKSSSGTYIRSLAETLSEMLGTFGFVSSLHRVGFGNLDKKLISLDSLLSLMHIDNLKEELKPIDYIFDKEIKIEIDYNDVKLLLNGVKISIKKSLLDNINDKESKTNKVFIASYKKDFLAIGKIVENDFYPKEVFDLSE